MSQIVVRRAESTERAALLGLFAHAAAGSPTESIWGDPRSEAEVYLQPYLDHVQGVVPLRRLKKKTWWAT